jgi:hypothetical protein
VVLLFQQGRNVVENAKNPEYLLTSRNNDSAVAVYDLVQSDRRLEDEMKR